MKKLFLAFPFLLLFASCSVFRPGPKDDGKISINLVQINDVYEIAPLSGGKEGGMARVATIKKQYLQQNPNTFLVIAGDFLSPSVYNSLQHEGKPIRGKQMVEALNAAGLDIAAFGNHEFDIREHELQERINESEFQWVSSNAFHKKLNIVTPFIKPGVGPFPTSYVLKVSDADGTTARIGIIGIILPFNRADYVSYSDPLQTAKEIYHQIKDTVDAVVAITHQAMDDDERLARELPQLAAIIGGHEHDQRFEKIGDVYITKALANAKSVFVVNFEVDKKKKSTTTKPEVVMLDETIALDSATNVVVQKWTSIADKNYSALGFDANKILVSRGEPLDGRESAVRSEHTNLARLIVAAMMDAAQIADVALLNGGSIRVDDVLHPPLTQYDILRTLPFGGSIQQADMKGRLLIKALDAGRKNIGTGGFLHYNDAVTLAANGRWLIKGQPIDPNQTYRVAMAEFLFTGKEANLDFLNPRDPDVVKVYDSEITNARLADIRMAVVEYLEKPENLRGK